MITYSVEQLKGVLQGIVLASKVSGALSSPVGLAPLLILIVLYALAWFSVQYNAGKRGIQSIFIYLLVSSFVFYLVLGRGTIPVALDYLFWEKDGKYVSQKKDRVSVSGDISQDIYDAVGYDSDTPVSDGVVVLKVDDAPLVVGLFSLIDRMAHTLHKVAKGFDTNKVGDNMEKERMCWNPEYMTKRALVGVLEKAKERAGGDRIDVGCMNKIVSKYMVVLSGFGTKSSDTSIFKSEETEIKDYASKLCEGKISDAELEERILEMISRVENRDKGTEEAYTSALMGGSINLPAGSLDCDFYASDSQIYEMIDESISDVANKCATLYNADSTTASLINEQVREQIYSFLSSPEGVKVAKEMTCSTLFKTENFLNAMVNKGEGIRGGISDLIASATFWASKNLNFDIYTKLRMMTEIQGVALAFIIGLSPLIAVFSLFPVGDSMINTKLLGSYFLAYFLVKLWLPVLYIIYIVAWNKLIVDYISKALGG